MIQQLQRSLDPEITRTTEEQLAISAIEDVGHDAHFLEQVIPKRGIKMHFMHPFYQTGVIMGPGKQVEK